MRSLQLTRAVELRAFRDRVLARYRRKSSLAGSFNRWDVRRSNESLSVLVYLKGIGKTSLHFKEGDLCSSVKQILLPTKCTHTVNSCLDYNDDIITHQELKRIHLIRPFIIDCLSADDTSFEKEVAAARTAHIIVSVHGTLSYVSLFAQVSINF